MFLVYVESLLGFLPVWVLLAFLGLMFLTLGILIFKIVAFVMDVLPFV